MIQCRIVSARQFRLIRVDLFKIADHRIRRPIQTVQVQAIDADAGGYRQRGVVRTQPGNECEHLSIAPHPGREALEVIQRGFGIVAALAQHKAIHAPDIGPIALDGDGAHFTAQD